MYIVTQIKAHHAGSPPPFPLRTVSAFISAAKSYPHFFPRRLAWRRAYPRYKALGIWCLKNIISIHTELSNPDSTFVFFFLVLLVLLLVLFVLLVLLVILLLLVLLVSLALLALLVL